MSLVAGMPLDGLGVLSGSALLTILSLPTGLSNGETGDHRSVANSTGEFVVLLNGYG